MEEKILYTGKIHWIAYLQPIAICFIAWTVIIFLPEAWSWKKWIIYFFIAKIIYDFFYYYSIKIILTDEKVYYHKGFLPWQKTNYHLTYDQIFECYYYQNILARIFNYGTITIAKSDGVRSAIIQKFITNPKKFSIEFETVKDNLKKKNINNSSAGGNSNLVEQLEKLVEMKRAGDISEDEFNRLKQSLMNDN